MPELSEVFEMVRNKTQPVPDAWEEQQERQRRVAHNRRIEAISLSAALAIVAALFILSGLDATDQGMETNKVLGQPPAIVSGPSLFDLETKQATRVAGIDPVSSGIAVSPDGTMIAYEGFDPGGQHVIYVASIDGTNVRALQKTAATAPATDVPQFSPDGSQIVYQARGNLFLVDVATGETTQLTNLEPVETTFWDMAPTFSPDGETVLFNRANSNVLNRSWNLWSVPATGGRPRLVLRDAALGRFSPDGRTIAYFKPTVENPFAGDMWLADADGKDARRLARGDLLAPRWSPDGTKIAYADRGRAGTYVVDVTTGVTSRVLDRAYWLEWLDGHTWIIGDG
ncbi:MAG: DPP IV N-terminal domain-containing protein [Actinomycetota bacterium]